MTRKRALNSNRCKPYHCTVKSGTKSTPYKFLQQLAHTFERTAYQFHQLERIVGWINNNEVSEMKVIALNKRLKRTAAVSLCSVNLR
jgi:hypothetical protein